MKKERRCLLINIFKSLFLVYSPLIILQILAFPFTVPDSLAQSSKNVSCPTVWVEVLPAGEDFIPDLLDDLIKADHTYIKVLHDTGKTSSWGCFGRSSGGKELDETKSYTHESNLIIIGGLSEKKPCKWDKKNFYGKIGVCHQLANRALYFTGKTVKNAKMYKTSSALYGTYGNNYPGAREYDMAECLRDKYKDWKDGYPSFCDDLQSKKEEYEIDKEIALYKEFFGKELSDLSKNDFIELIRKYNESLIELFVKTRLGIEFFHKYGRTMIYHHYVMMNEMEGLYQKTLKSSFEQEYVIKIYNQVFNSYFDKHKKFLSAQDFYAFFGWDKDKVFDIRWLLEN